MTSPRYRGLSPKQLVPQLADEGLYLASESTMYRLQRRHGLRRTKRRVTRTHVTRSTAVHRATGLNQVWSWDITWLPTVVRGQFLLLYLLMDVWSRRIVGWTIRERESASFAADLIQRTCLASNVDPRGLVLHSDNDKPMRGATMVSTLQWLGIVPSFSRPHVSNDNPYSESLFRTIKDAHVIRKILSHLGLPTDPPAAAPARAPPQLELDDDFCSPPQPRHSHSDASVSHRPRSRAPARWLPATRDDPV
jgi:transposase InsO family protein